MHEWVKNKNNNASTKSTQSQMVHNLLRAVDKTRNMEHPGTSNNYNNYAKNM